MIEYDFESNPVKGPRQDNARETYLQQCLYRSRFDRALRRLVRRPPRRVWRDLYR